jgi:hypothetical protein
MEAENGGSSILDRQSVAWRGLGLAKGLGLIEAQAELLLLT